MNNKEFEILNRKMNLMYEEIIALIENFQRETFKQEKEIAKIELENAQSNLNSLYKRKEYFYDDITERKKQFKEEDYNV